MNNPTMAKILSISELIEENITLSVEGITVECFLNSCPYKLETDKTYNVEFSLQISDSYKIWKSQETDVRVEKIGRGYAHYLYGELKINTFASFTDFHDLDIQYDHPYLNEYFIKLEVERINVDFL